MDGGVRGNLLCEIEFSGVSPKVTFVTRKVTFVTSHSSYASPVSDESGQRALVASSILSNDGFRSFRRFSEGIHSSHQCIT